MLLNLFNMVPVPYGLRGNRGGQVVLGILEEIPSPLFAPGDSRESRLNVRSLKMLPASQGRSFAQREG